MAQSVISIASHSIRVNLILMELQSGLNSIFSSMHFLVPRLCMWLFLHTLSSWCSLLCLIQYTIYTCIQVLYMYFILLYRSGILIANYHHWTITLTSQYTFSSMRIIAFYNTTSWKFPDVLYINSLFLNNLNMKIYLTCLSSNLLQSKQQKI